MRIYPAHEDLGLNPEADQTEDLRSTKNAPGGVGAPSEGDQNTQPAIGRKS